MKETIKINNKLVIINIKLFVRLAALIICKFVVNNVMHAGYYQPYDFCVQFSHR